jgi:hypothetical protein
MFVSKQIQLIAVAVFAIIHYRYDVQMKQEMNPFDDD